MKRFGLIALVLCGCGKPAPTDAQRIVGEWIVMDFHSPTEKEDRGQRRKHAIITEGTWSQQFQGEQYEDFEYTLNPSKSPKQIDLTFTDPSGKRLTVRGIYELDSDELSDRLRLCLGSPPVVQKDGKAEYTESVRPVAFEPKTGPLIRYRRKTE
jgi:uncharacterized protein (TIGR03067 family)